MLSLSSFLALVGIRVLIASFDDDANDGFRSFNRYLPNNRPIYSWSCVMENNYWKTAEQMNGRLAMMGLFAAVINYGFTGWIVPGII